MLSDNQHIDDFFRKKEEAFAPDNLPVEPNWQQFKTRLNQRGGDPDKSSPGSTHITRLLGLLVVAAVVLLIAINPFRHGKKKTTATTKQQTTVAISDTPTAPKPDVKVVANAPAQVKATRPAANKPAHEQSPILISAVPVAPVTSNKGNDTIESSSPDATKLLQSFFQQLEHPTQEFYINTEQDTTLVAAAGTRLFVPAHTLINKAGPVKITVREYYKYEDIIAAKLTTTSNGEQLITGGMLHISAEQDGQPVAIAPGKAISVKMPTNNYDVHMQLFTGIKPASDTGILNWICAGNFVHNAVKKERTLPFLNTDEVQPASVSNGKKTVAVFYLDAAVRQYKKVIIKELKDRFDSVYDEIKLKRPGKRANDINNEAEHPIIVGTTDVELSKTFGLGVLSKTDSLHFVDLLRRDSLKYDNELKREKNYNFTISNFGWFNCDRFLKDERPKVTISINLGEGEKAVQYMSQLVFTNYKSVMGGFYAGNKIQFRNVPEGEPVQLITVSVKGNKVISNFQSLTLSNSEISNLQFEPTTPEQHKQKLQVFFPSQKQ